MAGRIRIIPHEFRFPDGRLSRFFAGTISPVGVCGLTWSVGDSQMRLPPRAEEIRRAVLALALGHYGSWVLANWGFANGVLANGVLANRRCLHNWLRTRHVRGNCGPHESQRGTSNDQEFQHRTDFLC